jgi:hypothetical protein
VPEVVCAYTSYRGCPAVLACDSSICLYAGVRAGLCMLVLFLLTLVVLLTTMYLLLLNAIRGFFALFMAVVPVARPMACIIQGYILGVSLTRLQQAPACGGFHQWHLPQLSVLLLRSTCWHSTAASR